MVKGKLIRGALVLLKILLGLNVLSGIALIGGTILWHISPDRFYLTELVHGFKAGYGIGELKIHMNEPTRVGKVFLSDLGVGMIYWLVLRGLIFILLNILGLLKLKGILQSINNVKTFYDTNITNLQAIGQYALVAAGLSLFNISYLNDHWNIHFTFPFGPLIIVFIAFVLAEVFKEGKLLLEDKNMII